MIQIYSQPRPPTDNPQSVISHLFTVIGRDVSTSFQERMTSDDPLSLNQTLESQLGTAVWIQEDLNQRCYDAGRVFTGGFLRKTSGDKSIRHIGINKLIFIFFLLLLLLLFFFLGGGGFRKIMKMRILAISPPKKIKY